MLMLISSAIMLIPGLHAMRLGDWDTMRAFFYHATFFSIVSLIIGIGMMSWKSRDTVRYQLLMLLAAYILLPMMLAMPLNYLVPTISYSQSYFEMLSSLTTTGATVFPDASAISEPLHLWRASVAWMGGFMVLLAALTIMEPMNLGGFEIEASVSSESASQRRNLGGMVSTQERFIHNARLIGPPYVMLTGALALLLILSGDRVFVAVCHAMSVLSTSGITPLTGNETDGAGVRGEFFMAIFLFLAISRKSFAVSFGARRSLPRLNDPEIRLALICLVLVPALIFLKHFIGAYEIQEQENVVAALQALWGSFFTVLSFLTTYGLESQYWDAAASWSGLKTSGVVLLGLAVMGGGIATTAGGIKLLRIFALYKHGVREIQRLIHPNSVGGAGVTARRIRRQGAFIAWVFLMLFVIAIAAATLLLSATDLSFESSLSLAIASLTNTGPAISVLEPGITYRALDTLQLFILDLAMIVGRMEVLVVVALLNLSLWRQ